MTKKQPSRVKNLTIAGILALTGFIALVIALLALFIGLWLDSLLGQRGPITVCLLVLSVPFSLWLMTRLALSLVQRLPLTMTVQTTDTDEENDVTSTEKEGNSFD
jgi:hypothetical protein